ncbi:ABC transporter ATP-binding protein [Blastopirellula sp. JC732]|uniref:ABC transporter ATP-binding protein n=1 Tax=Blastopirellula sediminis TaxID=2894196 RepID=A0A9X1SGZ7_9BACT|nr:ABC transporter ATP-binding protein [Blastopirellula sediminis]MCC9607175.1 ABC transporter ATP-binding protein [Blastopirellula sediminis]MCC9629532.1 ABC transporter ATP-binding protein [Blastopirellula sediminis]
MASDTASNPQRSSIIRLDHVGRVFTMGEVKVEVLRDFSLDIYEGEFIAVVGPSGSGKSTILNLIGGLDQPTSGHILFRGEDLTTATNRRLTSYRRDHVGFVFQFYNLAPNLTARENVLTATEIVRDPADVDEVLEMVGLTDRADHFPAQLSGGEQQRVAIARAVAKNPSLLLCDEPTGALDYATGIKALRLLVDVNRRLGTTIVLITHNSAIAETADRVVHLRSGQISEMVIHEHPIAPEEVIW